MKMKKIFKYLFGITLTILIVIFSISIYLWYDRYKKFENFRLYGQEMSNWCWAASTQMVYNYGIGYADSLSQKEIVKLVMDKDTPDSLLCKPITNDTTYNKMIEYDSPSEDTLFKTAFTDKDIVFKKLKMTEADKDTIWILLKQSINTLEPAILFGLNYQKYGTQYDIPLWWTSHVVVIVGTVELTDKDRWLVVRDPWSGTRCKGCSYYLNFNSIFKDTTQPGQVSVKKATLIYNIRKRNVPITDFISRKIINFINTDFGNFQSEYEKRIIEMQLTFRRRDTEILCTVKDNPIGAYAVQVAGEDGRSQTIFFWRDTKRPDIFFDTMQESCFFEAYIPKEIKVLKINFDKNQIDIYFIYQEQTYTSTLNTFNQFLLSKDKNDFINKNSNIKLVIL